LTSPVANTVATAEAWDWVGALAAADALMSSPVRNVAPIETMNWVRRESPLRRLILYSRLFEV
jgi:hypothetical protein